jgi:hypothetical protein
VIAERLADLRPELDPTHLAVSRWPVGWRPPTVPGGFSALVVDTDEVTLVCSEEQVSEYDDADRQDLDIGWRRVTFAGPLPWEQVGFLADVAGRLAAAQIPFTSLSGFTTDHVLVRAAQADLAVSVLRGEEPPEPRPGTTNP